MSTPVRIALAASMLLLALPGLADLHGRRLGFITAPDGRNLMYDLALPASSASIDRTLTTCNRPRGAWW